jgi:hypothetical protein
MVGASKTIALNFMLLVAMVWYMFLTLLLLGVYEVVNVRHENRHRFSDLWEALHILCACVHATVHPSSRKFPLCVKCDQTCKPVECGNMTCTSI